MYFKQFLTIEELEYIFVFVSANDVPDDVPDDVPTVSESLYIEKIIIKEPTIIEPIPIIE